MACGSDSPTVDTGQATRTTPTSPTATVAPATTVSVPGKTYAADLTTTDGYRYKVTVAIGTASATGGRECPATATPGHSFLPVTLVVANQAGDRPAPFPPLRIEMTATAGAKPAQVLVRDTSGACTFTPKVASIAPGASVVFNGTSPAIDTAAAPGSAGRIEVNVSESTFSLVAPVP